MLNKDQIKATLEHCKIVNKANDEQEMCGDEGEPYFEAMRNKGWVEALTFVLNEGG